MTLLVCDVGSSSARAMLVDMHTLEPLATAIRRYRFRTEPPGAAELDTGTLRDSVDACIDEVLTAARQRGLAKGIRAVGMATFVGNVLAVNRDDGTPITPIYAYADTRSAGELMALRKQVNASEVQQRTGCPLHSAYLPARLRWLRAHGITGDVRWIDAGTYLYEGWFGRAVPCSYSVASWNGLLNRATLRWDADWLRLLGESTYAFPRLADYTAAQTDLSASYAARWPELRSVPFFLPVGDGVAANVGSGAADSTRIALTIGTTAALRSISRDPLPPVPAGLWSYRVDASRHLIGGATSEGGNVYEWVQQVARLSPDAVAELHSRPAAIHGLTVLPLLAGERSPGWTPDASGAIHGLRLSTTPLDLFQAMLEAVALNLSDIFDRFPIRPGAVMAGGGALHASPVWAQIVANALNHPLYLLTDAEPTARGVALLTLEALGESRPAFEPMIDRVVHPQPDQVARLREARDRQTALYRRLYNGQ